MQALTDESQRKVAQIASRYGLSDEAATRLLSAIAAGGGRQAQFNHPELGGMGQWSQGGMIMIGDMFNSALKAKVAALCDDLADALPDLAPVASGSASQRWPAELGNPSSTGSQNDMHYAVFPDARRLAVEHDGQVTIYDTQDHRIGGASQQQGSDQSLRFTSQSGVVRLADLPIVGPETKADNLPTGEAKPDGSVETDGPGKPVNGTPDDQLFSRLERLADLRSRDIITDEEFATKKAELLARL